MKKNRIIITSLVMASVLPFVGGVNSARADEIKNTSEKAKSDLDMARENLKEAEEKKTKLVNELEQAKKAAAEKLEEKKSEEDKLAIVEDNIKNNEAIIEKDSEIKKIDKELKSLGEQISQAEKEAEQAQEKVKQAEQAYEKAKNQSPDGEKFVPEDKREELKKQYEAYDQLLNQKKQKQAEIQEKYNKNVQKRNELSSKKEGIKEFFYGYERETDKSEKIKSQDYLDFKKKQEETYKKIDEEIRQKNDEAGPIGKALKSIGETIEGDQKTRDDKLKAYEKHKQAREIQKLFEGDKSKNLDKFIEDKQEEKQKVEQELGEAKENTKRALGEYQFLFIKEAERKKEVARSKAAADFLEERLTKKEDPFVIKNEEDLIGEKNTYQEKARASQSVLETIQREKEEKKTALDKLNEEESGLQQDYDNKVRSLEIARELKAFLENKKNDKTKEARLKKLEEEMNQAKADLKKKADAIDELSKKDDALSDKKGKLGDPVDPKALETAKAQLEKDRADVEKIKAHIKELEKSPEMEKVKKLEDDIREIETKIKEIEEKIKSLENNKQKESPDKDNNRNQKESQENDDYGIDLSSFTLEKIDEKAKIKNTISKFKIAVKKVKKTIARAEEFVKTPNIDEQLRHDLIKLIEKQKSIIKRVEKYIEKLEKSL